MLVCASCAVALAETAILATASGEPASLDCMLRLIKPYISIIGSCGAGVYIGMTIAGMLAFVRGEAPGFGALLFAMPLGALVGWFVAYRTRRRFVAALHNRTLVVVATSAAMMPFALSSHHLSDVDLAAGLVFIPGMITGGVHLIRKRQRNRRRPLAQPVITVGSN